jgi:multiple sugar transport system substrate-binding protein
VKGLSGKIIGLTVIVLILVVILGLYLVMNHSASTVTPSTTTPVTSTSNITLTVVTFSGQSADFIQYAGELFSQEHPGVTVKVYTYPFSEYISKELTVLEAGSSQYDIIGYTSTSAQKVAPYLVPLNSSDFNMSDIIMPQEDFGGIIYNVTSHQNVMIGIAYETAVYLMAYKSSIFENQTLANEFYEEYHVPFNPVMWDNWTDVIDADQFLTSHHITEYGFLIDDHVSHGIIDAYPAVYGWYYIRDYNLSRNGYGIPGFNIMFENYILPGFNYPLPSFNSTAGIEALETYKQLVSYEPNPSSLQVCYGNIGELYANASGAFLFTSQISELPPTQVNETLLAPLPGGYAETGTDFLGISKYSLHKQLALEFLQFLVSPKVQMLEFLKFGKFPISKEAFTQLMMNSSIPSFEREWLNATYQAALEAWANPPNIPPTYSSLIPDFNNEVYAYLTGQVTDPNTALQTAASEWMSAVESYFGG